MVPSESVLTRRHGESRAATTSAAATSHNCAFPEKKEKTWPIGADLHQLAFDVREFRRSRDLAWATRTRRLPWMGTHSSMLLWYDGDLGLMCVCAFAKCLCYCMQLTGFREENICHVSWLQFQLLAVCPEFVVTKVFACFHLGTQTFITGLDCLIIQFIGSSEQRFDRMREVLPHPRKSKFR